MRGSTVKTMQCPWSSTSDESLIAGSQGNVGTEGESVVVREIIMRNGRVVLGRQMLYVVPSVNSIK